MRFFSTFTLILAAVLVTSVVSASDQSSDERAIRDLDAAWSQAVQAKDPDKTVSFYADDASLLPANAPIATGKDHIREAWSHVMSLPGFSLSFSPTKIHVSKSRDLAYDIGTFESTVNDAQGQPMKSVGKYVVSWEKRGGQWKAVADIYNADK